MYLASQPVDDKQLKQIFNHITTSGFENKKNNVILIYFNNYRKNIIFFFYYFNKH